MSPIEFPTEIRLLSFDYTIERVKDLKAEDGDDADGLTHPDEYWIKLAVGIRGHEKPRLILLHELVHIFEEHTGISLKETQVDAVARCLYSLIVDNPDF